MMKNFAVLATVFILAVPAFAVGDSEPTVGVPRMDISNLPTQDLSVDVPLGHVARLTVTAAGAVMDTIPLATIDSHSGGDASCVYVAEANAGWVMDGGIENLNACSGSYFAHQTNLDGGVSILLLSRGTQAYADALDIFTFRYFFALCTGPSISGFSPLPDRASCSVSGNTAGFSYWDALAGNLNANGAFAAVYHSE